MRPVKFTRNPQFTPASLTPRLLSRVERLVSATFERNLRHYKTGDWDFIWSGKEELAYRTTKWFAPFWKWEHDAGLSEHDCIIAREKRHANTMRWLSNSPDAKKYFISCYNYLVAIARNTGEVKVERLSRAQYAQIRGSY